MQDSHLIHQANQIAAFFKAYPEDQAISGVAGHLQKFWDPRMHAHLQRLLAGGGDGLDPLVVAAGSRLAQG